MERGGVEIDREKWRYKAERGVRERGRENERNEEREREREMEKEMKRERETTSIRAQRQR
jgi:hypothetical protein